MKKSYLIIVLGMIVYTIHAMETEYSELVTTCAEIFLPFNIQLERKANEFKELPVFLNRKDDVGKFDFLKYRFDRVTRYGITYNEENVKKMIAILSAITLKDKEKKTLIMQSNCGKVLAVLLHTIQAFKVEAKNLGLA